LPDYEILFDPRVLVQNDDHTSPRGLYRPFGSPVDAVEKFRKMSGRSNGPIAEVLTPERACFLTISIERVPGVDARLGAQTPRESCKLGVTGQSIVI
jgi:hypothetical protein